MNDARRAATDLATESDRRHVRRMSEIEQTRPPLIRAQAGKVLVDIPLDDESRHPLNHRRIVVTESAIAKHLNLGCADVGAHNLEAYARNNLDLICRRALELEHSKSIFPNLRIDAPRGEGLADLIIIDEGQL